MKPYSYLKVSKFLISNWFIISRQTWSHVVYRKNEYVVIVPKHWNKDIPWPTIVSILRQEKYKKWF